MFTEVFQQCIFIHKTFTFSKGMGFSRNYVFEIGAGDKSRTNTTINLLFYILFYGL